MGGALVYSLSLMPVRRCPPLVHPLVPRLLLDPPRCPPEMFDCAEARLRVALRCRSLGIDLRLIGSSRHALRQVAIRKPRIKMARLVARSLRATTLRTSRSWHSSTTWLLRKSKNNCSDLRTTHPTFVPSNSRHDPGSFARRPKHATYSLRLRGNRAIARRQTFPRWRCLCNDRRQGDQSSC